MACEGGKSSQLGGVAEPERNPFSRDRARVLHCAALRRLAGKTQVVGPGEGDVPRTRLTHSLEVAQIGRGLAEELGCDPDVVDTAGLAHDIGHPPFGHNGEYALNEVASGRTGLVDCGGFEGNAQTLRILTRLEPKVIQQERSFGLNLTRASLDATLKYPWPAPQNERAGIKFGYYLDDAPVVAWIRGVDVAGLPGGRTEAAAQRCVEAQLMDWADDVAYSVHDLEDGIRSHRIVLRALASPAERAAIAELAEQVSGRPRAELEEAARQLAELPVMAEAADYDGSFTAAAGLKRLTSELVGRFAGAAVHGTRQMHGRQPVGRYRGALHVDQRVAGEVAVLKAMALRYVLQDPQRLGSLRRQREQLIELVHRVVADPAREITPAFLPWWRQAERLEGPEGAAARLRVVLDQVASLTDAQAEAMALRHALR